MNLLINKFLLSIKQHSIILWIVCGAILFVGALLHLCGWNNALGRSGSVLVAFAIFLVYCNFHFDQEIERLSAYINNPNEYSLAKGAVAFGQSVNWQVNYPSKNGKPAGANLMNLPEERRKNEEFVKWYEYGQVMLPLFYRVRKQTMLAEFVAGIVGTLVWGFGDLL